MQATARADRIILYVLTIVFINLAVSVDVNLAVLSQHFVFDEEGVGVMVKKKGCMGKLIPQNSFVDTIIWKNMFSSINYILRLRPCRRPPCDCNLR